jgi:hypothetical protein
MACLQFPSYFSKILVDPLQASNAQDYYTLFFQIVMFVEPTGDNIRDVNWELKAEPFLVCFESAP